MQSEDEVLGFWAQKKIFEKSVKQRGARARRFVFFEGPPYANGLPGIHHVEARAFKDVVARYKTMRGFRVERRAGWDTHGLPTEMAVEKKLGIKSKREIEERIGIRAFVEAARADVFLYQSLFERMTERMGYWLDFKNAYVTMTNSYIESLWWIIKEFSRRGFLYEDYKILPWCVRCGTALSSHELAQGYKKVTDQSLYVRFHLKTRRGALLVWTTTPWTLPANVAAAVDPEADYVTVEEKGEKFVVLASRAAAIFPEGKALWHEKGEKLLGLEYEPPFPMEGVAYKVIAGDFISSTDGTGIVHIAPAFGEDDMRVGKREGLPILMTIDEEGKFNEKVPQWQGIFVKDADSAIIKDLENKGFLWKQMPYEHEYPFCWRCDTPLLYMARKSWWVAVSKIRKDLVEANKKINWHPDYLKDGRFGGWIKEAKDWAFTRERYWGTPMPVWRCTMCRRVEVIGSLKDFSKCAVKSENTYYLMRHGFSKHNLLNIAIGRPAHDTYGLIPRGKQEVKKAAAALKKAKIDLIISSDLLRTRETTAILARELRVPVLYDDSIQEIQYGDLEGTTEAVDYRSEWTAEELLTKSFPGEGGESWNDVKRRMHAFFKRTEELQRGKKILIVGHADPLWFLEAIIKGTLEADEKSPAPYLKTGEWHKVVPASLPRNDLGEMDLHKPFIDEVSMQCAECGGAMLRTPEVTDVWFDSGSMPYASWHYPFENKERIDKKLSYPADFISEGIDQTRGWFYVLLAVSVLLGNGAPYKNVMSLGMVLDKEGKKMSKSRGNVVEPMKLFETYGADAVRWYFFTVNQPGDEKLFDHADVERAKRNFLDLLANTARFLDIYGVKPSKKNSKHVLDKWIITKTNEVTADVTKKMDAYDIVGAARTLERFVGEDISRWFLRRSRDRMRDGDGISTLREVLGQVACLAAPFTPFTAEIVYQKLGGKSESVHLANWPVKKTFSKKLLADMEEIRRIAALGLELRSRAGIKIRQPLAALKVKKLPVSDKALLGILKDELNVKEIIKDSSLATEAELDTVITKELKREGDVRELIRGIQDLRKKQGLEPFDSIALYYRSDHDDDLIKTSEAEIKKGARVKKIISNVSGESILKAAGIVVVRIEKVE